MSRPSDAPRRDPSTHAFAAQIAARAFAELRISAALLDGTTWHPIHVEPNVVRFELAHGTELDRWAYNERSLAEVRRDGRLLMGQHAGFCDMFVPVRRPSGTTDVLVTGPFSIARPTSGDLLVSWQAMTGTVGRMADSGFRRYVSMALATATFEGVRLDAFKRLLTRFATLLEGQGNVDRLACDVVELRARLAVARLPERMSEIVHELIDERTGLFPTDPPNTDLEALGIRRLLEHALVGVLIRSGDETDPLDELFRREAFQRASVDLCVRRRGTLSAPLGDYGIALLTDDGASGTRLRAALTDLAQRMRALARTFGFRLHVGFCPGDVGSGLALRCQAALAASERAVSRGLSVVEAERDARPSASPLRELRAHLARAIRDNPTTLLPNFTRFLDAAAAHCGYRLEPIRVCVEGAFDLVSGALRQMGGIDDRGIADLEGTLDRAAANASTVAELLSAYREAAADIEIALARPVESRQDRSIGRAIAYVRDHLSQPLRLAEAAHVAGLAPGYFSMRFAESEGATFRDYLRKLRVERAKYMLTATTLSVERVGQLSGFRSRNRFHVAFRTVTRTSPAAYRRQGK